MPGGFATALRQLDQYIDAYTKDRQEAIPTQRGSRFQTPPSAGLPVPSHYTPEAAARCLEVVLETDAEEAPGIIFYYYRWKRGGSYNGTDCGKHPQQVKNMLLAGFVWEATENFRWRHNNNLVKLHWKTAELLAEDGFEETMATLLTVYTDIDVSVDEAVTEHGFDAELMGKRIPSWFFMPRGPVAPPTQGTGDPWQCDTRECA